MGWSVKIGNTGQFTPVSGGLSIRFLQLMRNETKAEVYDKSSFLAN